jgi:hypothetical protein
LLLGRFSRQLRKSCAGANMMYSRAELLFILEHYLALKSFAIQALAMHTRQQRIRQHYTDWKQNFGTHEVFATGNMSGVGQR